MTEAELLIVAYTMGGFSGVACEVARTLADVEGILRRFHVVPRRVTF